MKKRYAVIRRSDERYLCFQNIGDVVAMWDCDCATTFEDASVAYSIAAILNQDEDRYCYVDSVITEIMECQSDERRDA